MAATEHDQERFDYKAFFTDMSDSERLQLSRDEIEWVQGHVRPEGTADVVLALSCGAQTTPYVMLTHVAVLRALGIDFVATAGQTYCCGNVYSRTARPDTGDRVALGSIQRFAAWKPTVNVQCCGSCYVKFSQHVDRLKAAPGGAPFEVVHVTDYLLRTLKRLGDAVPWRRPVNRRVLLHAEGEELHPTKAEARQAIIETLHLIPGVEYAGLVRDPSLGAPCRQAGTDGKVSSTMKAGPVRWALDDITSEQYRQVQDELLEQARAAGADTIVTNHHSCHREWSKFGSSRLPVMYYQSLVAEGLGIEIPDRFQILWRQGDPEKILELTRPHWESWNIAESEAREMVRRFFVSEYAAAVEKCPCEGNCFKATLPAAREEDLRAGGTGGPPAAVR